MDTMVTTVIEDVDIVKMEHIATVLQENAPKDVKNIGMDRIVTVKVQFMLYFIFLYLQVYKNVFFHLTAIRLVSNVLQ